MYNRRSTLFCFFFPQTQRLYSAFCMLPLHFYFSPYLSLILDSSGNLGTHMDGTQNCAVLHCVHCEEISQVLPPGVAQVKRCATAKREPQSLHLVNGQSVFLNGGQFVLLWVMNSLVQSGTTGVQGGFACA